MAKDKPSFEKRLERLKSVVDALERGDLPLEQSLALYMRASAWPGIWAASWTAPRMRSSWCRTGF